MSLKRICLCSLVLFWAGASAASGQDLLERESKADQPAATQTTQQSQSQSTKITAKDTTSANSQGKGNFVAGENGWVKVEGSSGKATFQVPKEPRYKTVSFSPIAGREAITNHMYISVINAKQSVVVSWHDLHDEPTGSKEIKEALEGAVKGNVARVLGQLDDKIKGVKVEGHPGREFDYSFSMKVNDKEEKILKATSRIILVGARQYQITMVATEGSEDKTVAMKVFDSFKLEE